jgi:hypothetical protein
MVAIVQLEVLSEQEVPWRQPEDLIAAALWGEM